MKTKKLFLSLLVVTAMLIGSSSIAGAACQQFGTIVATQQVGVNYTVWIAPTGISLPTYYYVFTTTTASLTTTGFMDQLNTAQATNQKVRILGTAAACGAAGVSRAGGAISSITTYSHL